MTFLRDPDLVITSEYDRDRRWTRSLLHDLRDPQALKVLDDRSIRDRYGDPGRIATVPTASGHRVALQHGPWIFRTGSGPSPDGVHPFLDRQNVETLETERLWQCADGAYESVVGVWLEGDDAQFITRHETPVSPPNYRQRGLGDAEARAVTDFPDPTPQIRGIRKEVVTYERNDGVQLSATLYLPADYEPGTRLPLLVWAYPIEFNDPRTAGQVTKSPHRFTRIRGASHLHLLTQGYAIMDGATMPIIGHPETMNDTFIEQVVAAARAAIDKAVELGVADGRRVGVGGHSYGAFMTGNLLAHCDLFRAGVARSGAYNRTLTPFGFQGERRPLWEAPEVYFAISPFMHADAINEPLLLIHGELDSNSGTFPMQSQRLFKAIKGNGGITRLVMLPHESHGYRARESVLHTLAEMIDWLDRYVKSAEPSPRDAAGP
jgi:dipeptidyl aminopeptidase/acylaminoacyl peptidase